MTDLFVKCSECGLDLPLKCESGAARKCAGCRAAGRVRKYLEQRATFRNIHPNEIHSIFVGDEGKEAVLLVEDLKVLLEVYEVWK